MTENKDPSYPWYPRDFAADEPVQLMSLAEEGAYHRLLDHQWLHGSLPGGIEQLAAICKNTPVREMKKMWPKIEPCFEKMRGLPVRLQNRKMERVREEREAFLAQRREAGSRGGKEKWKREREKEDEASDPTPPASDSASPELVAGGYPAVCSLPSASAGKDSLPAGAVEGHTPELRPHDLSSCIGLVVKLLYFGNRPSAQAMRNEASIAKALARTYGFNRLAAAIEGLAKRREAGELPNVGRHQIVSLKWLNSNKFELNQLAVSEDAFYRGDASPRTGRGGTATVGDVVGNIRGGAA